MRKTKKVLALYRRGLKALKKIKTTKKGDIKITSVAFKNGKKKKKWGNKTPKQIAAIKRNFKLRNR